jgi:hypothetical protein
VPIAAAGLLKGRMSPTTVVLPLDSASPRSRNL